MLGDGDAAGGEEDTASRAEGVAVGEGAFLAQPESEAAMIIERKIKMYFFTLTPPITV